MDSEVIANYCGNESVFQEFENTKKESRQKRITPKKNIDLLDQYEGFPYHDLGFPVS